MRPRIKPVAWLALAAAIGFLQPAPELSATSVTNGLVAHLKFDGNLLDATTNQINGTSVSLGTVGTNGVTFAPGLLGQAVHILVTKDGTTNDFVSLGYPALLHFGSDATGDTTDFSVALWLKVSSSSADEPLISNKNWDSGGNLGWVISNESDGTRINLKDDINSRKDEVGHAGPQLEDQNWHHLAVTFARTNVASIYVDGVLLQTLSIAPDAGNAVGSLDTDVLGDPPRGVAGPDWAVNLGEDGTGLYATNNGAGLDCLMDDVGIWRRALEASEVLEIYTKGAVGGQTLDQQPGPAFSTVIPVSYAMPAGSVNTNNPGFRVRPYETAATGGGTIVWNDGQQAGLYGPNLADLSGADANGYYTVNTVVNWGSEMADSFPAPGPFPGIGNSGNNFSEELLTYINFPAPGTYVLGVNSDDGFAATMSMLNPEDGSTAITLGEFNGNRSTADTLFQFVIPQAGFYPVRLLYWQTGGDDVLAFFSVVSDSTSTNYVLINDTSTPGALLAYATASIAPPFATGFNFNPAGFSFNIQDDISALNPSTLKVQLNGSTVSVATSKTGSTTTVTYSSSSYFAVGSSNTVTAQFSDNATPAHTLSPVFSFVVPNYTLMPPSAAVPRTTVDTTKPGMLFHVSQFDDGQYGVMAANIAHAEAQLAGLLIDPNAGTPYEDISYAGPQPDGSYVTNYLNFSFNLIVEQGSFTTANGYPDSTFPGIVGNDSANIAGEVVTYLDLQPGFYTFAVNATDGFRVTTSANPYDAMGTTLGLFDYRAISTETQFGVAVQTAGIYPIRLVFFRVGQGADNNGDAGLEFYTIDAQGKKWLVGDTSSPEAVKAYWKRTGTYGSFVKYAGPSAFVSPFLDSADVGFQTANVVISDSSSNHVDPSSVVWTVDGKAVTATSTVTNGLTTLLYTPTGLQLPRMTHTASLVWADAGTGGARHTNNWNFHLLRNYVLPAPLYYEDFESTAAGPNPTVPDGWTQVNFTGSQTPGYNPADLTSDFYLGWVVVNVSFGIGKDQGLSSYTPQVLNGVAFDPVANPLLVNNYIRAESDARQNGPPGQIQYLYTKPYDLSGQAGIVVAFDSSYEQNQDSIVGLEYTVDGTNYNPVIYFLQGDFDSQAPADTLRDGLGNIDVTATMMSHYGDVAEYTDPVSGQLVGGYYGFFIKAPITQALAPYIEGRYNDDGSESKRIELFRTPLADNQKSVVFRFMQAGTSSWYWAIDNWGIYSVPSLAVAPPGSLKMSQANGQATISWTGGGTLESASSLKGPWTAVPNATNPLNVTVGSGNQFYRLAQ
ncbi:MAG: LamG domain-containing protein [Limisphaerales bacterium]